MGIAREIRIPYSWESDKESIKGEKCTERSSGKRDHFCAGKTRARHIRQSGGKQRLGHGLVIREIPHSSSME